MALFDPGIGTQREVAAVKEAMEEEPCLKTLRCFFVMAMAEVVWGCRENGIDSEREQVYGFTNV